MHDVLARHGSRCRGPSRVSGKLRVLPLGGVGEIGKNMTVVEYDGRIVVVDCGLRFPTAEMMGIDLVLPDFTYLRENVDAIEAFVITHGHEDHLGALPWVIRDLGQDKIPVVYSGQLTIAMARSKLDEHKLRDVRLEVLPIGDVVEAGPFKLERIHLTHSIPDSSGVAITTRRSARSSSPATTSSTRRRSAARPPTCRGWPSSAATACCCCAATPRTWTARASRRASRSSARTWTACSRTARAASSSPASRRTSTASSRSSTRRPTNGRKVALVGRSMRKNVNIGRSLGHIDIPEGMLVPPREIDQWADEKIVIISTGSQGEPLSALRRMAYRDHPQVELKRGDTVVFSATPIPGNERAVNETIDRLYHIGCEVVTAARRADPRLRPRLRGGGQDDDQPHAPEVRDAGPRRLQADADPLPSSPRPSASRRENIFRTENGTPLEIDENGARLGEPRCRRA